MGKIGSPTKWVADSFSTAETIEHSASNVDVTGAIFVGTAGDLKVDCIDGGTAVLFKNIASGTVLGGTYPILVKKVYASASGSDADDLVALR